MLACSLLWSDTYPVHFASRALWTEVKVEFCNESRYPGDWITGPHIVVTRQAFEEVAVDGGTTRTDLGKPSVSKVRLKVVPWEED